MIRLRMFGTDGVDWCHQFFNWNYGKDEYKNIKIVSDDSYTHAALFGIPTPKLSIPKENVIGVQCEPIEIHNLNNYLNYINENIGTYFSCDFRYLKNNIQYGIPYLAPYPLQLIKHAYYNEKKFKMSIVASNKTQLEGHKLRHDIIRKILNSNMDIHIYGRGIEYSYGRDSRIKGTVVEKPNAMIPYYFTISIENVLNNFISEKFFDPILFESIPIYVGSENSKLLIQPHLKNGLGYIDINNSNYFDVIKNVYDNTMSIYESKIDETYVLKQNILNYNINMCEFIYKHFNKGIQHD